MLPNLLNLYRAADRDSRAALSDRHPPPRQEREAPGSTGYEHVVRRRIRGPPSRAGRLPLQSCARSESMPRPKATSPKTSRLLGARKIRVRLPPVTEQSQLAEAGAVLPAYEVILVTYKSRSLVESLLSSLPADLPVAIIDNASGADRMHEVLVGRTNTRYLDGRNAGFAGGANLGARTSDFDTVVFVNPDSSPSVEQLDSLVADLAADTRLAAVSAMTVLPNGQVEIGVGGWEPSVRRAFVHAFGAHKLFRTAGLWARPIPGPPIELDWISGACLAVPRATFLSLGGFDESYFIYNEDVAYGRRVRDAGLKQRVRTDLLVPHLGGGSGAGKERMLQLRGASLISYVRDHNSGSVTHGLRLLMTAGTLCRCVLFRLTGRAGQAQENVAYLRGMWVGPPDMST